MMEFSSMGRRLNERTGINDLMDDLYEAIHSGRPNLCQLNGGTPAVLPEVTALWKKSMQRLLDDGSFELMSRTYGAPRGFTPFRKALAAYLRDRMGWPVTEQNICLTQGGQMAFFLLFNLLADDRSAKNEILFPVCPEYVGYQAQSLSGPRLFRGVRPRIDLLGRHEFKYGVDFNLLDIRPETAAVALSRPTNPTGNVVTDEEMARLHQMAAKAGIPVIVDNAYGQPFPNISFVPSTTTWSENTVLCMSLSKIGLPGLRCGVVIARPEMIETIVNAVTVASLCPNDLGAALVEPYLCDGTLDDVCARVIRPYYEGRSRFMTELLHRYLPDDLPWRIHRSEGAMFLWLWVEGLPITAQQLYERCRSRGCYVNPGHHFFFALPPEDAEWKHRHECVRLSFTRTDEELDCGIRILAEEIVRAFAEK